MPSESKKQGSTTLMAVLCYFGILVLIPLLTDSKNDPFVKFHIKQGLVLLLAGIIVGLLRQVPIIGWLLSIVILVLFIIGIINAARGKKEFADKIKI